MLNIEVLEQFLDRLGTHLGTEGVRPELLNESIVLFFNNDLALFQGGLTWVEHDVGFAVQNLLKFLKRDVKQGADTRRQALEKPNVRHGCSQADVAHTLAPHLALDNLDAAFLTNHAPVLHALVLAAIALVVLDGPKNLGAKKTVALRLECPVVDGFRLLHLAMGPFPNFNRAGQSDADGGEAQGVFRFLEKIDEDVFQDDLLYRVISVAASESKSQT